MKYLRDIFDGNLTRVAGIIFILILALVLFNINSSLPLEYPLFGVFDYLLLPILFIAGAIIFVLAILRS